VAANNAIEETAPKTGIRSANHVRFVVLKKDIVMPRIAKRPATRSAILMQKRRRAQHLFDDRFFT